MKRKKIVVLTGAGISAESGIPTFRDAGGLWEGYDIMEVATPEGWHNNLELVLDFYNQRRAGVRKAQPNKAHLALAKLEEKYDVVVITQNIDDLHERAGSRNIIHLHGEIMKARSQERYDLLYDLGEKDIMPGDKCQLGYQLRPHVVWFGEAVPMMDRATMEMADADIFMVIGTSMQVYPAASLIRYAADETKKYFIDPKIPDGLHIKNLVPVAKRATEGVVEVVEKLMGDN